MLNNFTIMGRLVKAPDYRKIENGEMNFSVATYRIAVERDVKDYKSGKHLVDYFRVQVSNGAAEFAKKNFKQGMWITVNGSLWLEQYEKDGQTRIAPTIRARSQYPVFQRKAEAAPHDPYGPDEPRYYQDEFHGYGEDSDRFDWMMEGEADPFTSLAD